MNTPPSMPDDRNNQNFKEVKTIIIAPLLDRILNCKNH